MIPSERPHLIVAALSHPGEARPHNEDRFSVTHYRLGRDETPALLAVVADGIGGHKAGEVAAQITVDTTVETLAKTDAQDPVRHLEQAILQAGRAVIEAAKAKPEQEGMGSTVAIAWIVGRRLYIASVGDSRIYLLRDKRLHQLSVDHTWVQEAIDHQIISPEQARSHPHAHVLQRHIGGTEEPIPDLRLRLTPFEGDERSLANQGLPLQPGDQILLCSDGLTDVVLDNEIRETLLSHEPKQAVQHLVDLARARGGPDNITVVVLAVPAREQSRWTGCLKWGLAALIGSVALVALIAITAAAAWWFGLWPFTRAQPTPAPAGAPAPSTAAPSPSPLIPLSPTPSASNLTPTATYTPVPLPTVAPPTP